MLRVIFFGHSLRRILLKRPRLIGQKADIENCTAKMNVTQLECHGCARSRHGVGDRTHQCLTKGDAVKDPACGETGNRFTY